MKILAPIKNKEAGFLAININVDEIYCSGPAFSARSDASISYDDLKQLINYAHLYDVKIYITLNTMIKESNLDEVLRYADEIVKMNCDAIIIQDLGLLKYLNEKYPEIELHASTQMHLHNSAGVQFAKDYGVRRVVLAREMSLKDIKQIKSDVSNIEIEVFVHGALCTSYSGQCYYGAFYNAGSGNLGTCQQSCRKVHSFDNGNEHMLSLKDLGLKENINKLNGYVDSLKIEGRLKSKEYLYSTIKYYQSMLSDKADESMEKLMQVAFNRTYTQGRMFNKNGHELANAKRVNNHGLLIGKITNSTEDSLEIELSSELNRLDNIRVIDNDKEFGLIIEKMYQNNIEVNKVEKGKIQINNKHRYHGNGEVYLVKTRSYEDEIKQNEKKYQRKIMKDLTIEVTLNKKMIVSVDKAKFESSFLVEEAINQPFTREDIIKQFSKTSNTPYIFNVNVIGDENIFVVKSKLNEFRREIIKELMDIQLTRKEILVNKINIEKLESIKFKGTKYMVKTLEQALYLANNKICSEIYLNNLTILDEVKELFDTVIPVLPRVIKNDRINYYLDLVKDCKRVMVSELGMLNLLKQNKEIETNFSFNIANRLGLLFLRDNNIKNSVLSLELEDEVNISGITTTKLVYGHYPLMIMDYCPINLDKNDNCECCQLCWHKQYYLNNDKRYKLPLIYANDNILELYSHKPYSNYKNIQAEYHLVSFVLEGEKEMKKVIQEVKRYEKIFR